MTSQQVLAIGAVVALALAWYAMTVGAPSIVFLVVVLIGAALLGVRIWR
jgi:hypothetical protein